MVGPLERAYPTSKVFCPARSGSLYWVGPSFSARHLTRQLGGAHLLGVAFCLGICLGLTVGAGPRLSDKTKPRANGGANLLAEHLARD